MRKRELLLAILVMVFYLIVPPSPTLARSTEEPAVRAVLFYSPTCPHCHVVISDVLTPLSNQYGSQLQLVYIDITQIDGQQLYQAAIDYYQIPPERQGVPTLIIEEKVLVGSSEIPQQFPSLIKEKLTTGGAAWPKFPGLAAKLSTATLPETILTPTSTPVLAPSPIDTPSFQYPKGTMLSPLPTIPSVATPTIVGETPEPPSDPIGLTLAGIVLVSLIASLIYVVWRLIVEKPDLFRLVARPLNVVPMWLIPLLSLAGLGVSLYLAYVEISQVEAVCGPVGECNVVQNSPYAYILGVPVAVLGILNYLVVMTLWLGRRYLVGVWAAIPALGLLGLGLIGVLFSIYLTWLEVFVIRAVCLWCLSSAVIALILLFQVTPDTRSDQEGA